MPKGAVVKPQPGATVAELAKGYAAGWRALRQVTLARRAGADKEAHAYVGDRRRGGWRWWARPSVPSLADALRGARQYSGLALVGIDGRPLSTPSNGAVLLAKPDEADRGNGPAGAKDAPSVKRRR